MHRPLPFVSVVIPAFNEEKFISKTLQSLQQQNYQGAIEIIVVNNGSTDKTAGVASSFGVTVITESRKGVQYARQTGFTCARGDIIASTDADNTLPTNWISQSVADLIAHPSSVAVGGWFILQNGPLIPRLMVNYLSAPTLFCYKLLLRNILIGQNFFVWKTAFHKTAGFTNLAAMNEDMLLAKRLADLGTVTLHYSRRWAVTTSARRWNRGFLIGATPYFVNATCYAFFKRLIFKNFSDVREEMLLPFHYRQGAIAFASVLLFVTVFFSAPTNPVQAKISPITKKAEAELHEHVHAPNLIHASSPAFHIR